MRGSLVVTIMEYTKELEHYIEKHSEEEDLILYELNRETHLKMMHPRMLSGVLQGKILESFSRMINPKHILELGTYTGYSAICLAKGLSKDGKLTTIELDDETLVIAKKYFEKANLTDKIDIIVGDASELIEELPNTFDLVFLDADKKQYLDYYEKVLPKVRSGGYIIADNVLWDGKVVHKEIKKNDYFTKGILSFNQWVQNDDRVSNYILPVRDGMMIIRKL